MDRVPDKLHLYLRTIHPATTVDHCVAAHFTCPTTLNLVVAMANVLEVYCVTDRPAAPLVLYKHYDLHAPVASLAATRFSGHATDCLLLAFTEAKVSVVCFDAMTDDLHTVSLHYLEEEFLAEERCKGVPEALRLLVEPGGRCCALFCYRRWLLMLPCIQDEELLFVDSSRARKTQPVVDRIQEQLPLGDSVTVDLHQLGLEHVRDVCFLPGFAEPTVAVLHEQEATWAGRLAAKTLTCAVTALAISGLPGTELQYPVILRAPHLPHDSRSLLPLGEPASGVLVVGPNAILHVSQIRVICCTVNDYGRDEVATASYSAHVARLGGERGAEGTALCLSLQNCRTMALGPSQVLFALKTGDLFSLQLVMQGGMLHGFHFAAGATTTLVECMCIVGEYLFLGSRMGDSWLALPVHHRPLHDADAEPRPSETAASDPSVDLDAFYTAPRLDRPASGGRPAKQTDLQSLFDFFSDPQQDKHAAASSSVFALRKVDSLLNVGPIVHAAFGESAAGATEEPNPRVALAKRMARSYWEKLQTLELVACSGQGQTGAIHILQQGVRPACLKSSQLEAVQGLWALRTRRAGEGTKKRKREADEGEGEGEGPDPAAEEKGAEAAEEEYDTHLLITRARGQNQGTMVWQCAGGRLEEIGMEEAGFELRHLTVNVFGLFDGRMTVQVLQRYMAVLQGTERVCNVFFVDPEQSPPQLHAHHAEMVAPYLLLLTTQGTLLLYTFHSLEEQERLAAEMAGKDDGRPKSTAFVDMGRRVELTPGLGRVTAFSLFVADVPGDPLFPLPEGDAAQILCFVWWSCGALEVYSVPDFCSLFLSPMMGTFPDVAIHVSPDLLVSDDDQRRLFRPEFATELLVRRVGSVDEAPYLLLLLSSGELLSYTFFRPPLPEAEAEAAPPGLEGLRLRKFGHHFAGKGPAAPAAPGPPDEGEWLGRLEQAGLKPLDREFLAHTPCSRLLIPFDDIDRHRGVFLGGDRPLWLFSNKGSLVAHGMTGVEGAVRTLTPFHIPNCPRGFVDYRVQERCIHISLLQATGPQGRKTLTSPWPLGRVPLRATPHFVLFHAAHRTYTVVTSTPTRYRPRPSELVDPEDEEAQRQMEEQLRAYYARPVPHAQQDRYAVELYSSDGWERLDRIELDDTEVVVTAKPVQVSKEDRSTPTAGDDEELALRRRKGADTTTVQCIGTGFIGDEDMAGRGRVLLLDVYPRISSRKNDRKFLVLYHEPTKGPITAVTALNGYLLLAVSSKIMVYFYDWSTKRLIIASFYDAQFFITSLASIKNLVVYGDAYRSIYFARWREETRQLNFLGKDFSRAEVVTTELLFEGPQLALVSADAHHNLSVLSFRPEHPQTSQGLWLVPTADVHLDALVPTILPLRATKANPNNPYLRMQADKTVMLFCTAAGQVGYLYPIAEDKSRRLAHLCTRMYTELPHPCGLHPKAHRLFTGERAQSLAPTKGRGPTVIDGDLLAEFPSLDRDTQLQLARKAGSRAEAVHVILKSIHAEFPYF